MTEVRETTVAGRPALRSGSTPRLIMLHAGVADRRSWTALMEALGPRHTALAYDRPGFGGTGVAAGRSASDELGDVIDEVGGGPVTLVGNSQGGRLAVDFALARPDLVERLILIAPAVSGAPEPELTGALRDLEVRLDAADAAGDLDEVNRLEALIWLDGPAGPEGRVSGSLRDLFLDMNRLALDAGGPPPDDPLEPAYPRLGELVMPVLVIVGSLDLPQVIVLARHVARQAAGTFVEMNGVAHLPQLERPAAVAAIISSALVDG